MREIEQSYECRLPNNEWDGLRKHLEKKGHLFGDDFACGHTIGHCGSTITFGTKKDPYTVIKSNDPKRIKDFGEYFLRK